MLRAKPAHARRMMGEVTDLRSTAMASPVSGGRGANQLPEIMARATADGHSNLGWAHVRRRRGSPLLTAREARGRKPEWRVRRHAPLPFFARRPAFSHHGRHDPARARTGAVESWMRTRNRHPKLSARTHILLFRTQRNRLTLARIELSCLADS